MKFISIVVGTIAAFTATNANALEPCDTVTVLVAMHSPEGKNCTAEIDYNFLLDVLGGFTTPPEQYAAICGNESCKAMLNKVYTDIPDDCSLARNGASFKSFTDPVYNTCFPKVVGAN